MTTALDPRACYEASAGRDARFDGRFYLAVTTTGIYCRPSCPARQPRFENCRFFRSAAAASAAGFRACKLCRPDTAPGSRHADPAGDLAARALRLIGGGAVDEIGVAGLAARLAVSERTLHRTLLAQVGASPRQIATVRRVQTARSLLEESDLPMAEVAFAAGFGSIRQFNDVVGRELGEAPSRVRERANGRRRGRVGERGERVPEPGAGLTLRLRHRPPYDWASLSRYLSAHAIPGVEEVADGTHTRVVRGPHGVHLISARLPGDDGRVSVRLRLADLRDLTPVVAGLRRLYDLDADPDLVARALGADPMLRPLVEARPGLRAPGAVDGFESAAYVVLGQQVSLAAGRRFAARLAAAFGQDASAAYGAPWRAFPTAAAVAGAGSRAIQAEVGVTGARARTLLCLAEAVAGGLDLSPGADRAATRGALLALPGVGEWTAALVEWRCLGNPDVFPAGDLVARRALADPAGRVPSAREVAARAAAWAPWRSYALMHLWTEEALS